MKKLIKKGASLLMTAVLGFSSLLGMSAEPVLAAGEQVEVYKVSYPADGDVNYDGNWGHSAKSYMNGWGSTSSRMLTMRAISSYNGQICYCIEPGVPQDVGDMLTGQGEDFWANYPENFNHTISPNEVKLFIGRIMQYGYQGNISTKWVTQDDLDSMAHAYATQILIWETVVGERDGNFNKVDSGGADAVLSVLAEGNPLKNRVMEYYYSMEKSVKNHTILPSFMSNTQEQAQNIDMAWDGKQYVAVLTDTNNVLGSFTFSSSSNSLRFSVKDNQLAITSQEAPSETVLISATKTSQRRGVVVWTDGILGPDGGIQDIVTYGQVVNDSLQGFLKAKVSYGSAKIVKTAEDGKVEGVRFTITGNGVNQTVTTGANGEIQIDNLAPGTYTVTEQPLDLYETPESQTVTVVSGQTATVTFNNVLKRGGLKVTKTSEDGLVEGITFRLSGTSDSGQSVDEYAVTDSSGVTRLRMC